MNALEQARAIAADATIRAQRREVASLRIWNGIWKARAAAVALWTDPIGQTGLLLSAYLAIALAIDALAKRKDRHGS